MRSQAWLEGAGPAGAGRPLLAVHDRDVLGVDAQDVGRLLIHVMDPLDAAVGQEHVRGFQIPVHNAMTMQRIDPGEHAERE